MTGITTTKTLFAVALLALALSGCSSDNNTTAPNVEVDRAPPAMPNYVEGHAHDSSVMVQWDANTTDADLDGYKVYRVSGDRAVPLTADPVQTNSYLDANAPAGSNTYRVTSVDVSGNESAYQSVTVHVNGDVNPYHPDQP